MGIQPPPQKGRGAPNFWPMFIAASPLPKKGAEPPIFGPCLWRLNGCMDQDATWYGGRPRPRQHRVRWGPSSSFPKGQSSLSNFWPMSIVAKRLDGSRWHLAWRWVLVQATLYKVGSGDPSPFPQKRGQSPPIFGPFLLLPNGCMDQDATWYGGRPRPTQHCVRWGPSSLSSKGPQPPILGQCPTNGWMD